MAAELRRLIFIPTYNERDNAPAMCGQLFALGLDADVLFVDDNSPDGTGELLDALKPRFPRLIVQHRKGKLGIGTAHAEAIQWAYDQGYTLLVTMDCDFTHSPSDVPAMIAAADDEYDIAVGSRWLARHSLPGWNFYRRCITRLGHFLTSTFLGIPQDASGAFRAYRLDKIPREVFQLVKSRGYSFFYESLFMLSNNGFSIREVSIVLPARTYGHSKMTTSAAWRSATYIFDLAFAYLRQPEQFLIERQCAKIDPVLDDPQHWDAYWEQQKNTGGIIYELIAGIYRRGVIKRNLDRIIFNEFARGSELLHAGCGSGQVDVDLQHEMQLTAVDISPEALHRYCRNNPKAVLVKHASIFDLPFPSNSFDGIYNLGVVEHFTEEEIMRILAEFHRVLRPGGKLVIFWPHVHATSVFVLRCVHGILKMLGKGDTQLHPPEITYSRGEEHARSLLATVGLRLSSYEFGPHDFFVQAMIIAEKKAA